MTDNWEAMQYRYLIRRLPEAIVIAALIVTFGLVYDGIGIGVGLLIAVIWYASDVPYAIGAGIICLVVLSPEFGPVFVAFIVLFITLIVASAVTWGGAVRIVVPSVIVPITLVTLVWASLAWEPTWLIAAALLGVIGFGGYAIHRLAHVKLELASLGSDIEPAGDGDTNSTYPGDQ